MRQSPVATGLLLLFIMGCAAGASVLFPRRTWCRYLCPMGAFGGLCSSASVLELRPTLDLCTAKCAGHSCYKGTETSAGCPVFGHLMFQDSNSHCVLCLECVRNCPNGSPQLNLRVPARELWTSNSELAKKGTFTVLLLGLLTGLILLQNWESGTSGWGAELLSNSRFATGTAVLACCVGFPLAILWKAQRRVLGSPFAAAETRFWKGIVAHVPLVVAGYAAYEIGFVPELANLAAGLSYQPQDQGDIATFSVPLIGLFRIIILTFGFLITAGVLWRHHREESAEYLKNRGLRSLAFKVAASTACSTILLALMLVRF